MDVERLVMTLPFLVLAAGGLYQLVRYRTLRGANLGARILHTIGDVEFGQGGMAGGKIRVLRIAGSEPTDPTVGVDSVVPFLAPYQLTPFRLTREQARQLGALLTEAANG